MQFSMEHILSLVPSLLSLWMDIDLTSSAHSHQQDSTYMHSDSISDCHPTTTSSNGSNNAFYNTTDGETAAKKNSASRGQPSYLHAQRHTYIHIHTYTSILYSYTYIYTYTVSIHVLQNFYKRTYIHS